MADWEMARSRLVVLPIAETTTIGLRARRAFTREAMRSMAAADSTEVPPNFITIMSVPEGAGYQPAAGCQPAPHGCRAAAKTPATRSPALPIRVVDGALGEEPFGVHQLGVEDGGAGGSADCVVAECDELPVEYRAGAQAADECCHASVAFGVFAGFGAVLFRHVLYGMFGSAREIVLLRDA